MLLLVTLEIQIRDGRQLKKALKIRVLSAKWWNYSPVAEQKWGERGGGGIWGLHRFEDHSLRINLLKN